MSVAAVKSYSIWVMPRGSAFDKLHAEIKQLAARVPSAPTFLPHVTLVGGVHTTEADMLARAQQLASKLKPYRISFDCAAYGSIFHQCVYLLCTSSQETMQAGAAARIAYNQDPGNKYMPHLSLLYSDIEERQRQAIAREEQQRLIDDPLLNGEELAFNVASLAVWETDENDRSLRSWRQLAEYPFQGQHADCHS